MLLAPAPARATQTAPARGHPRVLVGPLPASARGRAHAAFGRVVPATAVLAAVAMPSRRRAHTARAASVSVMLPKPLGLKLADSKNGGALVEQVVPGGFAHLQRAQILEADDPREETWVMSGDRVVAVDGKPVNGFEEAVEQIQASGEFLTLSIEREDNSPGRALSRLVISENGAFELKVGTLMRDVPGLAEGVEFSCECGTCKTCWHTDLCSKSKAVVPMCCMKVRKGDRTVPIVLSKLGERGKARLEL